METKEIVTPCDNHKVVIKTFITGFDLRKINRIYSDNVNVSVEGKEVKTGKINPAEITDLVEDKVFELIVVSIDGKTEDILNSILEMKSIDYVFVKNAVNEVTDGKAEDKKKHNRVY